MRFHLRAATCSFVFLSLLLDLGVGCGDEPITDQVVISTIHKAGDFYRRSVSVRGGYVYYYSTDLAQRWGEGRASEDQIWVQPPGTPTVGMAYLKAYDATGDRVFLDAARDAAGALIYGQLRSGGWSNSIDTKGQELGNPYEGGKKPRDGTTSLDDGQTQSAIEFMVRVDQALRFSDPRIHESAMTALDALLDAQFANGAFPQGFKAAATEQPLLKANYPKYDWRVDGRIKNYWDMYTLNDNVCGDVADTLATAHQVYGDDKYLAALRRLGHFLVSAQMPDPQPAWAQQYNYDMQPIWARKFEPPAIAGDESQEVMETLMNIFIITGDRKYLEPIPRALMYLKRSLLSDGRLARYYELETNKPLYMFRKGKSVYELTYDDTDLPSHYGWKWDSRLDELEKRFAHVTAARSVEAETDPYVRLQATGSSHSRNDMIRALDAVKQTVGDVVQSLDEQGRWVSTYDGERLVGQPKFKKGMQYLSSEVFSRNLTMLSNYIIASKYQSQQRTK